MFMELAISSRFLRNSLKSCNKLANFDKKNLEVKHRNCKCFVISVAEEFSVDYVPYSRITVVLSRSREHLRRRVLLPPAKLQR